MKTDEVLKEYLAGKRMSRDYRMTVTRVCKRIGGMFEDWPVRKVEVNKWLASLEGYSDTSVRTYYAVLKSVCKYMNENYNLPDACRGVEVPRVMRKKRRYFTPNEIARVLQACKDDYELALVTTLVDSACRVGEIAGLRVRDVGDGWIDVKGKTGERRHRLDPRICEVLRRLGGSDDELVFKHRREALSMRVIYICKRAGLTGKKLGPHTLRHSSASLVASETGNVMAVKAILQHDDISTSMIYIHDVEDELQKRISPLALVGEKLENESHFKQLSMAGSVGNDGGEVVGGGGAEVIDELMVEMFPDVAEGVEIRPLLRTEDLRLIRMGFIALADGGRYNRDIARARELMKRMLRKVRL